MRTNEQQRAYRLKNKDRINRNKAKSRRSRAGESHLKPKSTRIATHFVVYKHTSKKGDVYIGSGTNFRPYTFAKTNRSKEWHDAFDSDCEVHILAEFRDRDSARELEKSIILEIGLDNLVNKYN